MNTISMFNYKFKRETNYAIKKLDTIGRSNKMNCNVCKK